MNWIPNWMIWTICLGVFGGAFVYHVGKRITWYKGLADRQAGWLWFATVPRNARAARVGVTEDDPKSFLPDNVKLIYKEHVSNRALALQDIGDNLSEACIRDQFYDRQAVEAYISHLRGEW